jgi:N-acetylneuraminic acid mutarotase
MWALDLANQGLGWQARGLVPDGRSHFGYVAVNGIIYMMAGQQGIDAGATFLKSNYSYNPATNAWTRLPTDLPGVRSHLSPCTIAVGGKIYMFGGESAFNADLAEVLEYDPATDAIRHLTPLPAKRASGAAGYIDGKFVFAGGKNNGLFRDTFVAQIA